MIAEFTGDVYGYIKYHVGEQEIIIEEYSIESDKDIDPEKIINYFFQKKNKSIYINPGANIWG